MKIPFTSRVWFLVAIIICIYNNIVQATSKPVRVSFGNGKEKKEVPSRPSLISRPAASYPVNLPKAPKNTSENPAKFGFKLPESIPSRPFRLNPVRSLKSSVDPVRFLLTANKTTVTVGEEIELTIRAVLLDIPPSLLFFFEEQKSFSLKLLLPTGFEITGGTYTDLISATLDLQSKPSVEYTVKGKFTQYSPEPFKLLRGPKEVSGQSLFENKAELVLALQPACTLNASQVRAYEPTPGVLVIEVPENPTSYLYSLDNSTFYATNFFPRNPAKSGTVYVREKLNVACVVAVNYSFAPSKPVKGVTPLGAGATPLSDSPCDDPSAKPFIADAGGVLSVYNCGGTPMWIRDNIYLPGNTMGENHIIACNYGGNGSYTVYCYANSGGCGDQYSDPVYVSSCPPDGCWMLTGSKRCINGQLEREEFFSSSCNPQARVAAILNLPTRWVLTGLPCEPSYWEPTGNVRCDVLTEYYQEREERDVAQGSPSYNVIRWVQTGVECLPVVEPNWQPTGGLLCDATTEYYQKREERDVAVGSPSYNQTHWIQTGQTCPRPAAWQSTGNFRCDGSTNYQQEREERDVAQGSPTYDQTRWIPTGQSCIPSGNWQNTGNIRCDGSTNYQEEREERDIAQGSPTYDQTRWILTGQICVPSANWQATGVFRCDGSTNYQQEREERDVVQGSPTYNQTRWISTGQTCVPGANWQNTGNFRCDASTNYQQEREERDVAQGSSTFDQTRWTQTGQTCTPGADWQGTGVFRCDASTNFQQEREERDIAQGSSTYDQTRWTQTGQTCTPGADWQRTGVFRCDASTNYQQEREERDVAQGSSTFDQTRWISTGQTCTPGADWQGTGNTRCNASTNYQQEREERDIAQGSSNYDQTRWTQTGQTCVPGADWQGTGVFRCDASTNFQQEREERDVAQGSSTFDQTRWISTGQTCTPGADWQGTGIFRCDASTNYQQEREERDIAQGSSTYDQIRWTQTGQTCTIGSNWQGTGNTRCDASTNYQQEAEERDIAQGSATFDQTRWTQTGQTCTPNANWHGTGNFRCDASTNYLQEREEQDGATGSLTYNQTRWVPTGQECSLPTANWQTTGNTRCQPTANRLEREELDMASGSATYNQTRWILTTDCCPMTAPTIGALPAAISGPQAVTLTSSSCAFSVEWSGPGGTSSGAVLVVSLSQTTTFTARCVDGSCQSPSASVTVQRITVPAPIIRTNLTSLCPGDTLQLTADGCEGLVRWSNGMTGSSIRFTPTATATYSATCVVSNVASEASNAIGILVQTAPTGASATTGQTSYTTGQPISLSATAAGATRYEWSGPGGFRATGQSVSRPNATVGMSGSYTVRAYSGVSCPAVASVPVTVQPLANCTLAFDGEPLADCDVSASDTTRRGRITVKVKNQQVTSQLQIALYQPVANGGYQLTSIIPNSPAVFTGLKEGTYRVDAYEITGVDTCRAGSRLVTVNCHTTVSGCNIRIKAVDSQNTETDVLPRVGGVLQPLLLSVEHLEGASGAGYTYQWTRTAGTGAAVNLATTPTLSAPVIGEYAVKLMSGTDTCTAYLTVRSKPCTPRTHTYACGTTPAIPLPDNGSRLSNLAPGDTIRAADFDIIVTEVSGGGSEGWNGIGYAEIPYLQGSRIAIELKGVVVNDCYELVGGTAVSAYDPLWGGITAVGVAPLIIKEMSGAITKLSDLLSVPQTSSAELDAQFNTTLEQIENARIEISDSPLFSSEEKQSLLSSLDSLQQTVTCVQLSTPNAGARRASTDSGCGIAEMNISLQTVLNEYNTFIPPDVEGISPGSDGPKKPISQWSECDMPCYKDWGFYYGNWFRFESVADINGQMYFIAREVINGSGTERFYYTKYNDKKKIYKEFVPVGYVDPKQVWIAYAKNLGELAKDSDQFILKTAEIFSGIELAFFAEAGRAVTLELAKQTNSISIELKMTGKPVTFFNIVNKIDVFDLAVEAVPFLPNKYGKWLDVSKVSSVMKDVVKASMKSMFDITNKEKLTSVFYSSNNGELKPADKAILEIILGLAADKGAAKFNNYWKDINDKYIPDNEKVLPEVARAISVKMKEFLAVWTQQLIVTSYEKAKWRNNIIEWFDEPKK